MKRLSPLPPSQQDFQQVLIGMWGSDYPRTITAITYRMSYDFIVKSNRLTEREKALFLGENAQRFYGINHILDLPYIKNMSE